MFTEINIEDITRAGLIFLRIGGILLFLPVFGDTPTPARVRVLLAGALTMSLYPLIPYNWDPTQTFGVLSLGWVVIKELFIGFTIGFVARLAFDGVLMAASLVGYQMGFGMANLLVPDAQQQLNAFTAAHRILVFLIFFSLNLHYIFINGINESFAMIRLGGVFPQSDLALLMIDLSAEVFSIAIQLAAPILVALMFTMAALGLIARTVPQMNVFTLSFPASFFIGLLVYSASFPFFPEWVTWHFTNTNETILTVIKGMAN